MSALVGVLVSALALAMPASAEEQPDLHVTFPEVTRFNPTTTDYVVQLEGSVTEGTRIYAQAGWGGLQELTVPGATRIQLGDLGDTRVQVFRCSPGRDCAAVGCGSSCTFIAQSPPLAVYSSARLGYGDYDTTVGGAISRTLRVGAAPQASTGWPSIDWALVASASVDAPALTAGTVGERDAYGDSALTYEVPRGLAAGEYWLRLSTSSSSPEFGSLTGVVYLLLTVDTSAPRGTMKASRDSVFPSFDGYRDEVVMSLTADEPVAVMGYELRDRAGRLVLRDVETPWRDDPLYEEDDVYEHGRVWREEWDGRVGTKLVPGTYDFRWVGFDRAENESQTTPVRITVSNHRIRRVTWTRTFPAARTVLDREVGRCSTLRRPATRRWRGSLGYLSQTRCRRPQDSVVATVNGVYVPKVVGRGRGVGYKSLRLSLYGGGLPGRRAPYLVLNTFKAAGGEVARRDQFGARTGNHGFIHARPQAIVRDAEGRPYVAWQTGLTDGARYRVKSFTVTVEYIGLAAPPG
ncbi:hypothetical protein [Nocardioides sp. 503]|uniref:hypothetical protein n=1 Tax=Nocardioides sp. 503 TaxID=2508326 RepID=UPI00106F72FE|nr:hypothetical protein [Nocardioides sp. 503]